MNSENFKENSLYKFSIPAGSQLSLLGAPPSIIKDDLYIIYRCVIYHNWDEEVEEGIDWDLVVSNIEDFGFDILSKFMRRNLPCKEIDISELPLYISDSTTDLYTELIKEYKAE